MDRYEYWDFTQKCGGRQSWAQNLLYEYSATRQREGRPVALRASQLANRKKWNTRSIRDRVWLQDHHFWHSFELQNSQHLRDGKVGEKTRRTGCFRLLYRKFS
jgi:hypothetical protein